MDAAASNSISPPELKSRLAADPPPTLVAARRLYDALYACCRESGGETAASGPVRPRVG